MNEDMGGSPSQSTGLKSEADVPWNEEISDSTLQSSRSRSEQEVDGQWPEASLDNGLERTWESSLAVISIEPQWLQSVRTAMATITISTAMADRGSQRHPQRRQLYSEPRKIVRAVTESQWQQP